MFNKMKKPCLLLLAVGIRPVVSVAAPIDCLMVGMVHGVTESGLRELKCVPPARVTDLCG